MFRGSLPRLSAPKHIHGYRIVLSISVLRRACAIDLGQRSRILEAYITPTCEGVLLSWAGSCELGDIEFRTRQRVTYGNSGRVYTRVSCFVFTFRHGTLIQLSDVYLLLLLRFLVWAADVLEYDEVNYAHSYNPQLFVTFSCIGFCAGLSIDSVIPDSTIKAVTPSRSQRL